ncbi:MAG: hypothetical protein KF832_28785 [Caldilineaceae bacterium]|nr:hypothetical protein [Caldilineaceae bacterium]
MCQHVVILAEREGYRYVSQCEHGTVHLVWDAVGLHLPADAFAQLANRILQTASTLPDPNTPEGRGHCLLQVGRTTVALYMEDFLPLAQMVEEALPQVERLARPANWQPRRLTFPHPQSTPILN